MPAIIDAAATIAPILVRVRRARAAGLAAPRVA
jgi:hypothetical protein